jgi:energy-coupling factor transporter ATP-binding protein EcfA2
LLNYELNNSEKEYELLDTELRGNSGIVNPFPGLRPFGVDECHLFFGREGQVDEVLLKLSENRFITVLGYSGSGKSSLMYCGIIPILYGGFMTDTGADWNIVVARPGYSPLDNLAESLIQHDPEYADAPEEDRLIKRTVASAILRGGSSGLIDIARQYKTITGDNLFILIDQFEEIFRFKESNPENSDEATAFIKLLLEAVESEDVPIYIAVTMRSDFIGECAQYPGLTELINKSSYVIPQMTREQKRMAVEGPIAVGGGRIAPRLVKRVLKEIGDNQDQLPIMQHALMRTWDYWAANREKGEELDIRHYNAVGKIAEALSQHADEAFDQLSPNHRNVAEVLFKRLTERGSDNFGIRRPGTVREVAKIANVDESIVIEVVEHFRQPGLSLLMPPPSVELYADSIIEISHESLMRIWTKLKNWVDEENESADMYMRISEAAALYQIGRTGLWRPPDLQLALNWQKKQAPTRYWAQRYDEAFERAIVFLDTSRITYESEQENQELLQKRILRRTRVFAAVLGIAAIIAIIFGMMSLTSRIRADQEAEAAKKAQMVAETAQNKAVIAEANAVDASIKSLRSERTAIDALAEAKRANEELTIAVKSEQQARRVAIEAQNNAENQALRAQEATKDANEQRDIAQRQTLLANQRGMLSIAAALAGKSLRERNDELKGLMALQSYSFNAEYGGKEFDNMIYDALYYALATFGGDDYNMFKGHRDAVKSVVFSGVGSNFFSTGSDGKIYQWDLDDNKQAPALIDKTKSEYSNRAVKVSPDKKWLLVTTDSTAMKLFNINNLAAEPTIIVDHKGLVRDAEFMPDNSGVVFVSFDGNMFFYDFQRSRLLKKLQHNIYSIEIEPNGKFVYGGTIKGEVVRITMADMSETIITSNQTANKVQSMDISKDGNFLAYGNLEGDVVVYDLFNDREVAELHGHNARVNDIAFSNNGKRLATASWDHTIQIWNMDNLDDLPYYLTENGNSYAWDITFSPDDEYLVVGTKDGIIKKWAIHNSTLADQICEHLNRNMTAEEWLRYVSPEVEYKSTCTNLPTPDNS